MCRALRDKVLSVQTSTGRLRAPSPTPQELRVIGMTKLLSFVEVGANSALNSSPSLVWASEMVILVDFSSQAKLLWLFADT